METVTAKSDRILLLGDPMLHEVSAPVLPEEVPALMPVVQDLHDILFEFKAKFAHYGAFRGIAAPQIGVMKRLVYMYIDRPVIFFNPELKDLSPEMMTMWDDCMCFPNLLVQLERHRRCRIEYRDEHWQLQSMDLEEDLSELLQHEVDHLDGILATQRAMGPFAFRWRM